MKTRHVSLGRERFPAGVSEHELEAWYRFVADLIEDECGLYVEVDVRGESESQADQLINVPLDEVDTIVSALNSLHVLFGASSMRARAVRAA